MNRKPLGKAVKVELNRNCLLCTRWIGCRDPEKDMYYACSRFSTEMNGDLFSVLEQDEEEDKKAQAKIAARQPKKFNRYNSDLNITDEVVEEDTIQSIIDAALNSGSPVPPDLRINDRDIPKARNVVEWMTSPRFIGGEQQPFGKQIQVAGHALAEWCPDCSDEDYFECVPVKDKPDDVLDNVVFLENGKCPKCKATKAELVEDELLMDPFDIIGIVGQRGTKSTTWSMVESYTNSKWLLTPNLPATFKVLPSSVFTSTYTATTFGQAKGSFWDPLNAIFLESEWYRQYHKLLTEVGRRSGEELYKHSETILTYRHKNMFLSPASPSQRSLRGKTRISAVIDEAGWFKTGQKKTGGDFERMNGNEVYTALKRSLSTMRAAYIRRLESGYSNLPKPLMALISSPSARNDLIMTRYRKSQGSTEVYSFKYPTWEFNPNLPRKTFNEEFRVSPVEAMRDYGCEPPMAANPWIKDEGLIESSFTKIINGIEVTTKRIRTKSGKLATSGEYKTLKKSKSNFGGIMGLDAGWNNNSFAFAICYPTSIPDAEDEDEENVLVGMNVHLVGEIIPRKDYPISFTRVYKDVLLPLCQEFNVAVVISDRWQNKKIVQDLEEAQGISYYELQLNMQNFADYKEMLYSKDITHPRLEMKMEDIQNTTLENYPECFKGKPVSHLCYQMMTVQSTGTAVIKGDEGATDDILRACVIAHAGLQDEEILDECVSFTNDTYIPSSAIGVLAVGSSGGRSMGGGASNVAVGASRSTGGMGGGGGNIGVVGRRSR